MQSFITLDKKIGETPLSCAEAWREAEGLDMDIPLAYAGRLDPMASGKLLVLIGDECKNQTNYHNLDKAYDFSVLFGIESDSLDVLGRLNACEDVRNQPSDRLRLGQAARSGLSEGLVADKPNKGPISNGVQETNLGQATPEMRPTASLEGDAFMSQPGLIRNLSLIAQGLIGKIELPYPRFSAKTVQGKPLHMWTLEGRLDEIEIPTKESEIYSLELTKLETLTRKQVADQARAKIDTIPEVTDPRKALGKDFRRTDVRQDWENLKNDDSLPEQYLVAHFHCIASSGTYMRTLASVIAGKLSTCGLAWHIHRTEIGSFDPKSKTWPKQF
tara:strand:- start:6792 stop:7781 length:990 start_codon:yes stop_codon:yes gene_type:complete